jgi:hypothetical protein
MLPNLARKLARKTSPREIASDTLLVSPDRREADPFLPLGVYLGC